jgi:hypothetical protein
MDDPWGERQRIVERIRMDLWDKVDRMSPPSEGVMMDDRPRWNRETKKFVATLGKIENLVDEIEQLAKKH